MRKLMVLLLPCLLLAGQVGIEPVTSTGADGIQQTRYRINTGDGYIDHDPLPPVTPPNVPADTGVLWVDRNHRFGIVQATAISGDGYHILANWYLNAQRAGYYRPLGDETPLWESPGDFPWAYNGQQIGVSRNGTELALSSQNAAVKWSATQYPDWTFPYSQPGTGFTKVSRTGNRIVTCQNGTVTSLRGRDGAVLWTADVPEPSRLQGLDLSNNGSIVAVTVYDSCIIFDNGVRRGGIPIGTTSSGTQYAAAISGDGSLLVTGDFYGKLRLWRWDSTNYVLRWEASVGNPWVAGVNISNDGSTIACGTGYANGKLCVFDSSSATPLWVYQGYGGSGAYVPSVALSADGSRIAAASWGENSPSGTYKVFTVHDRDSAGPIFSITRDEEPGSLFSCDISNDGQFAVCGGKAVHAQQMGNGGEVYAVIIGASAASNVGVASVQQPTRYMQVGTAVTPQATVQNYGDSTTSFLAHLVISDSRDSVLYLDSAAVSGLAPGGDQSVSFGSWTPGQFDLYSFKFFTALAGDSYPGDDTLVMKAKCFHDGAPIRIGPPNREVTINSSFTPVVTTVNNGSYNDGMSCLLVIRDSSGAVVYAESTTTGTILPDDTTPVQLPPTSITMVGAYTATAVITCADDFYPANDTFRFAFDVTYEVMYDDGGWEAFYWVGRKDNDKFYVRYTPTIPAPYAITGGRIYVNQANQVFDYVMLCPDASGLPDTTVELARVENVSAPSAPGWIAFDFDVTRRDDDDVWMVMHWPNSATGMGVGADVTQPLDLRSYFSSNQDPFTHWTTHDWMARMTQSPNVGIEGADADGRFTFRLLTPEPNPFQNSTALRYEVPALARVALKIYDGTGRLVATPVSATVNPGRHTARWNARDAEGNPLAPGIYFARLHNHNTGKSTARKLTLVK